MQELDDDVLAEIFTFLPLSSFTTILCVNSHCNSLVEKDVFWKRLFCIHFRNEKRDEKLSWKENTRSISFKTWCMWNEEGTKVYEHNSEYFTTTDIVTINFIKETTNYQLAFLKRPIPTRGVIKMDFKIDELYSHVLVGIADPAFIKDKSRTYIGYSCDHLNIAYASNGYVGQNSNYSICAAPFEIRSIITILINAEYNRERGKKSERKQPFGELTFYKNGILQKSYKNIFSHPDQVAHFCIQHNSPVAKVSVSVAGVNFKAK
jgi:hypothetical protein